MAVIAIFISNLPEGLSSPSGMRHAGRSKAYVFGVWGGIAVISGVASLVGYTVFRHFPPEVVAATTAVAAGAILAMLADTMIPEAFEEAHNFAGLITGAWLSGRIHADQDLRLNRTARQTVDFLHNL